jgi:hypothetical protein
MRAIESNPELARAQIWAEAHQILLQRAFERFDETGEWPQLEDLQHDFTVAGRDDVEVSNLAYAMPRLLGFVEQGRLVLLTRGLSHVGSAAALLDIWAEALHIACQRWIKDHKTARLSRQDIEDLTHDNRHTTDLVSKLLLRERWAFGDGRGNPTDDWEQEIIDSVRIARDTTDARALLQKRAAVEFPELSAPEAAVSNAPKDETEAPSATPWDRLRRFFRHPLTVAVVGGVLVLLIWAILSDGFSEVFGGGGSNSTTRTTEAHSKQRGNGGGNEAQAGSGEGAQHFKEMAGEGGASTYANPHTLSEPGNPVEPGQTVKVICRVYAPEPPSVNPDGYWYRLASLPWNGRYYAPANSFWNGDIPGHRPYTHNTDKRIPICG